MDVKIKKKELRNEYGKILLKDNAVYEGECLKGQITGYGKMTYSNGQIDIGMFYDGKLHGKGKRFYIDQTIYEGEFVEGLEHGKGYVTIKSKVCNFSWIKQTQYKYGVKVKKVFKKVKIKRNI